MFDFMLLNLARGQESVRSVNMFSGFELTKIDRNVPGVDWCECRVNEVLIAVLLMFFGLLNLLSVRMLVGLGRGLLKLIRRSLCIWFV